VGMTRRPHCVCEPIERGPHIDNIDSTKTPGFLCTCSRRVSYLSAYGIGDAGFSLEGMAGEDCCVFESF